MLSFLLVYGFLCCAKAFQFNCVPFDYFFVFIFSTVGGDSKKTFLCVLSKNVFLMFPVRVLYCPILALGL